MDYRNLEHMDMPLLRYDRFGRSIWHNTQAQTMLIDPMDEMLGLQTSAPEPFSLRVARYFRALHKVLRTAVPTQIELVLEPHYKRDKKTFLISFFPELDTAGDLVGVLAAAQDISGRLLVSTETQK